MDKTTILIVEDEMIVAADLAGKLTQLGYEVIGTAASGEEAVEMASRFAPGLVMMDIRLKGAMDGIQASEAIRGRIDVPVIYLTAHSDSTTIARAKLTDPFGYILKPFEERELAKTIEMALYKHHSDRQIREQREWLRVTLTSIGDAVVTCDIEGKVTFLNPVAEELTGWRTEEAQQMHIQDVFRLIDEKSREPLKDPVADVLRDGRPKTLANHTVLIRKDAHEVPIEDSAAPILDAGGRVIGVVLVFHDVTAKRRAQEALRKAHDELEVRVGERTAELSTAYASLQREREERKRAEEALREAQKMEAMGTLAGGIAHDFNNILAAIIGFTEMAIDDVPDRPVTEKNLKNVLKSSMRARELVKQILTFSRKAGHERNALSISPVIKETLNLLRASIPTTIDIKLSVTASSDTVVCAPIEVQQILMNLATNASLAMRENGGTMEIGLADIDVEPDSLGLDMTPGEYIQLVVKDSGCGMGPDVMRRVFEPFFTTREVGKGTGMGLAVVYGIVKDLKGTITVESEPGKGSTFRVMLPKTMSNGKTDAARAGLIPTGREKILFVDDEEMLAEWGQATLGRLGYSVTALTDSKEALKVFTFDPSLFDLVITDQTMHSLTGLQLAKELMKMRPNVPIILCTGHSDSVNPDSARAAGIKDFLIKPLAKQELAEAVRKVLDGVKPA